MKQILPTLTVAISTRGTRAACLNGGAWPVGDGIGYIVLLQDPDAASVSAALTARCDVTVVRLDTTGLSRSRNAALDRATGEILLVTDDDITHFPETYEDIRVLFAENPEIDILTGQSFTPDGNPRKRFPSTPRDLRTWNCAGVSSHEIAIRLKPVRAAGLRFDECFGVGAGTKNLLGEEYIFLADCLRAGLRGRYHPVRISTHPPESTGSNWSGAEMAFARAAVFTRVFGNAAPLMRLAFAAKNARRFSSIQDIWRFLRG